MNKKSLLFVNKFDNFINLEPSSGRISLRPESLDDVQFYLSKDGELTLYLLASALIDASLKTVHLTNTLEFMTTGRLDLKQFTPK